MKSLFRKYSIIRIISLIFLYGCTSQGPSQDPNVNRKISQDECERVFAVSHVDYYTVFIYEDGEIKQVRWGYPQGHRGTILYKAIHHCATDKVVMTISDYTKIFSGLILNDYQGRSEEISIHDGPIEITTYVEWSGEGRLKDNPKNFLNDILSFIWFSNSGSDSILYHFSNNNPFNNISGGRHPLRLCYSQHCNGL